jgi:hypothetical protein
VKFTWGKPYLIETKDANPVASEQDIIDGKNVSAGLREYIRLDILFHERNPPAQGPDQSDSSRTG